MNINVERLKKGYVILYTADDGNINGYACESVDAAKKTFIELLDGSNRPPLTTPKRKSSIVEEEEINEEIEGVDLL